MDFLGHSGCLGMPGFLAKSEEIEFPLALMGSDRA